MQEKEFNNIYLDNVSLVKEYLYTHIKNRNDVDDLTQEVFIKILNTKKEIIDIRSYLFIISKNLTYKYNIKKKPYLIKTEFGEEYNTNLSFDTMISIYDDILTKEEKEIIIFHLKNDMTFEMIAKEKNVNVNKVAFYYYHGIQKIKNKIS